MRTCIIVCAVAGLLTAASCSSREPLAFAPDDAPEPPFNAVLTESEAAELAEAYIDRQGYELSPVGRQELRDDGYLFYYQTPFDAGQQPPKTAHVVAVHHDGTIRELLSDDNGEPERDQAD